MAMKIKTEVAGYGPRPADTHALINVFVSSGVNWASSSWTFIGIHRLSEQFDTDRGPQLADAPFSDELVEY
jgi:hypothetical protein